jgi:hypothetical protein
MVRKAGLPPLLISLCASDRFSLSPLVEGQGEGLPSSAAYCLLFPVYRLLFTVERLIMLTPSVHS